MASNLITAQHNCEGLLKIILSDDTVTVDLEVMTLTGVHVYKNIGIALKKGFYLEARRIHPLQHFKERLGRPKDRELRNFGISSRPTFGTQF